MKLSDELKVVLADTFALYLKAHYYHWNVEGVDFAQHHNFLEELYNEVWGAVDGIAEQIRTLDVYVPGSLGRFKELTSVEDDVTIPTALNMIKKLQADNVKVIASLTKAYKSAEEAGKLGISNYLQDRIQAHEKHGWMLRAISKV
jgi:starvation-inducible DNA-binding protein